MKAAAYFNLIMVVLLHFERGLIFLKNSSNWNFDFGFSKLKSVWVMLVVLKYFLKQRITPCISKPWISFSIFRSLTADDFISSEDDWSSTNFIRSIKKLFFMHLLSKICIGLVSVFVFKLSCWIFLFNNNKICIEIIIKKATRIAAKIINWL